MALTTNLVNYWKLDEASGNASDGVGAVTLTNSNSVGYGSGKINNCADFGASNTNKYFSAASNLGLSTYNAGVFSVSMWVNVATAPTSGQYQNLFGVIKNTEAQLDCKYWNDGGTLKIGLFGWNGTTGGNLLSFAKTLTTNTWFNVIFVKNGTTITFYVDGTSIGSGTYTLADASPSRASQFTISADSYDLNNFFKGLKDEVGVWTKVLTSTEITQLYNAGVGISYPFGPSVKVLVIGGGGSGGVGGGGAGGYQYNAALTVTPQAYTVTVGDGGASTSGGAAGNTGGNSVFDDVTAYGGGAGGPVDATPAGNGGSGGGGGSAGGIQTFGGTGSQGNSGGGNGNFKAATYPAGGGGGATSAGGNATSNSIAGAGGAGTSNSISGSAVTYSGGGGGAVYLTPGTAGAGGAGGGGAGGVQAVGTAGTANTGGGGGGAGDGQLSGAGGSGIVIISYATDGSDGVSTSSTGGTVTTSGDQTIHTFTTSGTFTVSTSTAYTLAVDVGAITLSGVNATFNRGINLNATVSDFTLTGSEASFNRGYSLNTTTQSFTITGLDVSFSYSTKKLITQDKPVTSFINSSKVVSYETFDSNISTFATETRTFDQMGTIWSNTSKTSTLIVNQAKP